MTKLQEFIKQNKGKFLSDLLGTYRGQCVSLAKRWLAFNRWPARRGNAIDWRKHGDNRHYRLYPNTPSFVPKPGDLAIFSVGKYGHIGVVVSATVKSMQVFSQNWPKGTLRDPASIATFDYKRPKSVGFLRHI